MFNVGDTLAVAPPVKTYSNVYNNNGQVAVYMDEQTALNLTMFLAWQGGNKPLYDLCHALEVALDAHGDVTDYSLTAECRADDGVYLRRDVTREDFA